MRKKDTTASITRDTTPKLSLADELEIWKHNRDALGTESALLSRAIKALRSREVRNAISDDVVTLKMPRSSAVELRLALGKLPGSNGKFEIFHALGKVISLGVDD